MAFSARNSRPWSSIRFELAAFFAEKARELISKDKVSAVFGCWTSSSRKSVLPVFEELNSILFYPVQYEGEESSRNIFYNGAAPNQQAIRPSTT